MCQFCDLEAQVDGIREEVDNLNKLLGDGNLENVCKSIGELVELKDELIREGQFAKSREDSILRLFLKLNGMEQRLSMVEHKP